MADTLLQNADEKLQFFGALTFNIKINLDWQSLQEADAAALLHQLLSWLIAFVDASEEAPRPAIVVKKICGSLAMYFLRWNWEQPIRHMLCSFRAGQVVSNLSQLPPTHEVVGDLNKPQLMTTSWFLSNLVEEVGKTNHASIQT